VRATNGVYETAKIMGQAGYAAARAPGPVPGIGTKIVVFRDPDEWKVVVVDSADLEAELV
jgi:lactoylglutathione lyase